MYGFVYYTRQSQTTKDFDRFGMMAWPRQPTVKLRLTFLDNRLFQIGKHGWNSYNQLRRLLGYGGKMHKNKDNFLKTTRRNDKLLTVAVRWCKCNILQSSW